jgi:hypothetical protein
MLIVKEMKRVCLVAPSARECVTEKGQRVYIRYRHVGLTVRIGDSPNEVFVIESQLTDEDDSYLSFSELQAAVADQVLSLEPEIDASDN